MRLTLKVGFGLRELILATLVILVGGVLSFACPNKKYEGKGDKLTAAPYYDGVKSTIDHVDPPVNSIATFAWCGLDYNLGEMWIQAGWLKIKGESAKMYWEYTDENGNVKQGFTVAPAASETYQVSHEGDDAVWKHGATTYKTHAWSNFDGKNFDRAVYTAEMHDSPADHTPGGVSNKNKFASTEVRKVGGSFAAAAMALDFDGATNGEHEVYGGSGNMRTWDTRD